MRPALDNVASQDIAQIGAFQLSVQAIRDSPYRDVYTVRAFIGLVQVGHWGLDLARPIHARVDIATAIQEALLVTSSVIPVIVSKVVGKLDSRRDPRPVRTDTVHQLAELLRPLMGTGETTVPTYVIQDGIKAVSPGRAIAATLGRPTGRDALARRLGVSEVEYKTGADSAFSSPCIVIIP